MAGTLLSSRNTRANKQEALRLELLGPADRIGVVRVTAIDDDITLLEMGGELFNKGVDGIAGLDKEDNFAWLLQFCSELLNGMGTLNIGTWKVEWVSVRLLDRNKFKGIN
jgi:hypothetical protein